MALFRNRTATIALAAAMAAAGAAFYIHRHKKRQRATVVYPNFGIPIPPAYSIHGIDVSRYQQGISWKMVRAMQEGDIRVKFAFIKATEGTETVDPCFEDNWAECGESGLVRGAYHYFIPSQDGAAQAENFIANAPVKKGDFPPVIDVEDDSNATPEAMRSALSACLSALEKKYRVKPIIYTNPGFYDVYLKGFYEEYPLWIAHYGQDEKPGIARPWTFWQHSCEGHISGITPQVDFNVFNGDSVAFQNVLMP